MVGTVKSIDPGNQSGVIFCEATGEDVAFHFSSVASQNYKMLHQGQKVQFYIEQGSQATDRRVATKVTAVN